MNPSDFSLAGPIGFIVVAFVVVLAVAALLMPLFVMQMHSRLKVMEKMLKEMVWYARKQHEREEEKAERR